MSSLTWASAAWLVSFILFCGQADLGRAAGEVIYQPSFDNLRFSPRERLSRFDLRIWPGMVIGFCRIPIGWRIEIDNDPSWMSHVSGVALVGSADLDQKDFREKLLFILPAPDDLRRYPGVPKHISVTGSLWLADRDATRHVKIRGAALVAVREDQGCR